MYYSGVKLKGELFIAFESIGYVMSYELKNLLQVFLQSFFTISANFWGGGLPNKSH
jgi:hypothetical protein